MRRKKGVKILNSFLCILAIALWGCSGSVWSLEKPLEIVYPNVNGAGETSFGYAVLKLALENAGHEYSLRVDKSSVNNNRIRYMILTGKASVADFGTSASFERNFLPIYFPIDMGVSGWRLFVIHALDQAKMSAVSDVAGLRTLIAGQGVGWSDVEVLNHAGIQVTTAPDLNNLFKMLEVKRFDFLPLGVNEIYSLLDSRPAESPNVVVESDLALVYPFARLFFVKKDNTRLHDVILKGLEVSFENGSFWELYKSHPHNRHFFDVVNLSSRKIIRVSNPLFSDSLKHIPEKYFFKQEMLQKKTAR